MSNGVRDRNVDFIKGMLMLGVIYGHVIDALCGGLPHAPVWLHVFARTFDLPFFMCISGYYLKSSMARKPLSRIAIDRITMIFAPIIVWTILTLRLNIFGWMYYFLWAVIVICLICIFARGIAKCFAVCSAKMEGVAEFLLLLVAIGIFYEVSVPWNLFYLFPFFVFGYYLKTLDFQTPLWGNSILAAIFVLCLCFWSPQYNPWRIDGLAWKGDISCLYIYLYRTVLAVSGICIMNSVFRCLHSWIGATSRFTRLITWGGQETLALYILHAITISVILRKCIGLAFKRFGLGLTQCYVNVVGYLLAPVISLVVMLVLLVVIHRLKANRYLKYLFGFKI